MGTVFTYYHPYKLKTSNKKNTLFPLWCSLIIIKTGKQSREGSDQIQVYRLDIHGMQTESTGKLEHQRYKDDHTKTVSRAEFINAGKQVENLG